MHWSFPSVCLSVQQVSRLGVAPTVGIVAGCHLKMLKMGALSLRKVTFAPLSLAATERPWAWMLSG